MRSKRDKELLNGEQCIASNAAFPRPGVSSSPGSGVAFQRPRNLALAIIVLLVATSVSANVQKKWPSRGAAQSSHAREVMSPEARDMVERAMEVVCTERMKDPQGSIPIDDMQGRPSLPVGSREAVAGAQRAQRLLPVAKDLVVEYLNQLAVEYRFSSRSSQLKLQQAIRRIRRVRTIKPDMESRDNASVLLGSPVTITFGTIFLAGLPSDEGMISVLGHELVHIADGDHDSLRLLYREIGNRASGLTGLSIHGQKAEELTCDLMGVLAARGFVEQSPSYEPLPRRISRTVAHNCVAEDEGDEDHLSPRNTIRALLALKPTLARELVYGRAEQDHRRLR